MRAVDTRGLQRLAVVAACISAIGMAAVPFAGRLGSGAEVVSSTGAPAPAVTVPPATPAPPPPPAEAPAAEIAAAVPAPEPPPVAVEAPPIEVLDPSAGVGPPAVEPDPAEPEPGPGPTAVAGAAAAPIEPEVPAAAPPTPSPTPTPTPAAPPAPTPTTAPAPTVTDEVTPTTQAAIVTHPERVWVVSIGIDDYPGTRHDLAAARADAITVSDTMVDLGLDADHLYELLDGAADTAGILGAVDWLVEHAGPGDTAIFAYAGHIRELGGGTEVLVAADGSWIADWFLAQRFAALQSRDAWFAIAGCYGGGFDELLAPGRILTAAADPGELAYESTRFGRSYMVEYLFNQALLLHQAEAPTVQAAVAWANEHLAVDYPDFQLWHEDDAGHVVSLDGAERTAGPGSGSSGGAPGGGSPPPETTPPRDCFLLLCG